MKIVEMAKKSTLRRLFATEFDIVTKVMLTIFVTVSSYIAFLLILGSVIQGQPTSMYELMQRMMYVSQYNLVALSLSLAVGLIFALLARLPFETKSEKEDKLEIIKKALSDNEKAVVNEVKRAGRITQDSLRFRLGWNKTKVSRILTNLDKMNLIQRERTGKTYIVFLSGTKIETV